MSSGIETLRAWFDRRAVPLALGAIALLILVGVVAIVSLGGLDNAPGWWVSAGAIDKDDPGVRRGAERLENAITTQLTSVRDPADPRWTAAIDPEQANAWLAARLIDTITTHQGAGAWPSEIDRIRVGVIDDQLVIGARLRHASGASIVWARVALELDGEGQLWARLSSVHLGTTPVPRRVLSTVGRGSLRASRLRIGRATLELGDGRVARLVALRINAGRLEIVMETLLRR